MKICTSRIKDYEGIEIETDKYGYIDFKNSTIYMNKYGELILTQSDKELSRLYRISKDISKFIADNEQVTLRRLVGDEQQDFSLVTRPGDSAQSYFISTIAYLLSWEFKDPKVEYVSFGNDRHVLDYKAELTQWIHAFDFEYVPQSGYDIMHIGMSFNDHDRYRLFALARIAGLRTFQKPLAAIRLKMGIPFYKKGEVTLFNEYNGQVEAFTINGSSEFNIAQSKQVALISLAEDNKVIAYEFNGITEFKFTGPREVTAIDAHDLTTL